MVNFQLTDEQKALKELSQDFANKEIRPIAAEYDELEKTPFFIVEKAHEIGLMNLSVPEQYGGGGLGYFENCIVGEELAAACSGISTILMANTLALTPFSLKATPEQMEKFVAPLCAEPKLAAFCLTEPGAGSDAASVATTAKKTDKGYVINGRKCFITNGSMSDVYTVFASTDRSKGVKGLSAFIVPADTPGVSAGKKEKKMGQRASTTTDMVFEDVEIPYSNLLGAEGEGFKIAMITLDSARAAMASAAVGVAREAMQIAAKYLRERIQFGKPLAAKQALQFMIADMAVKIEGARLLAWQAAWMSDQKMRHSYQAAISKCYAADTAMQVTTDAVQILGGYGYMKDYPVEKLMRDAKLMQIYEGTNQIQRLVISRFVI